jgi:hypothetical protein
MKIVTLLILYFCGVVYTYNSPNNRYNVQKFISSHKIEPFVLFTILNNCCKCIMQYHKTYKRFHGNTTLSNFYMYDNYNCVLLNNANKIKGKQYLDYCMLFDSYSKELCHHNLYFVGMLNRHRISVFESLVLFQEKT